MKTSSELKQLAKARLRGNFPISISVIILQILCLIPILFFSDLLQRNFNNYALNFIYGTFTGLLINALSHLLSCGCQYFFLNLSRNRELKCSNLFFGFKNPDTFIISFLATFIVQFIISLPINLIVYYLIRSNNISDAYSLLFYSQITIILIFILTLFFTFGFIFINFIIMDNPNIPALEAVKMSWRMTKGQKLHILYITLSFIPLALLCVLTLGIGLLWLLPYVHTTTAFLYRDTIGELNPPNEYIQEEANQF
jgi:Predicted integral membrane protein